MYVCVHACIDVFACWRCIILTCDIQILTCEQIFVEDNNGAEQTCLSGLRFYGSPVATTKMGDFKKVEE